MSEEKGKRVMQKLEGYHPFYCKVVTDPDMAEDPESFVGCYEQCFECLAEVGERRMRTQKLLK